MDWKEARMQMVEDQLVRRGIANQRVLRAMEKVPRHWFVPNDLQDSAYRDAPLPIGEGQTISQPYMVALMTERLGLKGDEIVLELGTGSGYQTAILSELAETVFTIERIAVLSERAAQVLRELGYSNVQLRIGDGTYGWPEKGPFDAIIVTAAAPEISGVLFDQLRENGRMVVPVGSRFSQTLYRVTKTPKGLEAEDVTSCVFVPLIGDYGWKDN